MSATSFDPAFACRPEPHVVIARFSNIHCEARLAGSVPDNNKVGIGTDPEMALAHLTELDPRAEGLDSEVRDDPDE